MPHKLFRVCWTEKRTCFADVFAMTEDDAIDKLYYADIKESDVNVDKEDILEVVSVGEING